MQLKMPAQPIQSKNPTWSRDELILALALYAHFKGNPPGKSSSEVVKLSGLLNEIGAQIANQASDFRNANGVYMKVMNFRRFDPTYISQGKKGLQRGGKLEQEVWDRFASEPIELPRTAKAICQLVTKTGNPNCRSRRRGDFAKAEE